MKAGKSPPTMPTPKMSKRPAAMKPAGDDAMGSLAHRVGVLEKAVTRAIAKRPAIARRPAAAMVALTPMKATDDYGGMVCDSLEARVQRLEEVVRDL